MKWKSLVCGAVLSVALAAPAQAAHITGDIGFSGFGLMTFTLAPGASYIDFVPLADGSGEGLLFAGTGSGTLPTFIPIATPGDIDDLATAPTPGFSLAPPGVPVSIDDFLEFNSVLPWNFQLNLIPLASCIPTATQQCLGPFQLNQNGDQVSVDINITGTLFADGEVLPWSGTLSAQFNNTTIAAVIAAASSPTGIQAFSWSGEVAVDQVPEPASLALFGIALVGAGMRARRRRS
jgi:hypothetical protein